MQPQAAAKNSTSPLRELPAWLRSDLVIRRQVTSGKPVYVFHDPVSFASHRLTLWQYRLVTQLAEDRKLADAFALSVEAGWASPDDEPLFYRFIAQLYQKGLVVIPAHNWKRFSQLQDAQSAVRSRAWMNSLLFPKIPLGNPDQLLEHSSRWLGWLFSPAVGCVWLVALIASLGLLIARWDRFVAPIGTTMELQNLPSFWLVIILLKIWHELGHGIACKSLGGRVPEMGTILIVGNPLAYVDATAAWSFPRKRDRLTVMLAGMYFETLIAIPATLVWYSMPDTASGHYAYQMMLAAGLTTLVFNANPLMKFDGYFVLSELCNTPNLRRQSSDAIAGWLKRIFLGVPYSSTSSLMGQLSLIIFGLASHIYRFVLVLSIAKLISTKIALLGLSIAVWYLFSTGVTAVVPLYRYLFTSPELSQLRLRSYAIAIALPCLLVTGLLKIPMSTPVVVSGRVANSEEFFIRTDTPGRLESIEVVTGESVAVGTPLVRLGNIEVSGRRFEATAQLQRAIRMQKGALTQGAAAIAQQNALIQAQAEATTRATARETALTIESPVTGTVARTITPNQLGQFLRSGETVGVILSGRPTLRAWIGQRELESIEQQDGSIVSYRLESSPEHSLTGELVAIQPASLAAPQEPNVRATLRENRIPLDPRSGAPLDAYFEIEIRPTSSTGPPHWHGGRLSVALPRKSQSLGSWFVTHLRRFYLGLSVSS